MRFGPSKNLRTNTGRSAFAGTVGTVGTSTTTAGNAADRDRQVPKSSLKRPRVRNADEYSEVATIGAASNMRSPPVSITEEDVEDVDGDVDAEDPERISNLPMGNLPLPEDGGVPGGAEDMIPRMQSIEDIVEELGEVRTAEATRKKLAGEMLRTDAQSSAVSYARSGSGGSASREGLCWFLEGCEGVRSFLRGIM